MIWRSSVSPFWHLEMRTDQRSPTFLLFVNPHDLIAQERDEDSEKNKVLDVIDFVRMTDIP